MKMMLRGSTEPKTDKYLNATKKSLITVIDQHFNRFRHDQCLKVELQVLIALHTGLRHYSCGDRNVAAVCEYEAPVCLRLSIAAGGRNG